MSRVKRQRLSIDGEERVTASSETHDRSEHDHEPEESVNTKTEQQQGRSLFVRSLPPDVTTERLTSLFSQTFPIKHATVVTDSATHKSKGYGFVTFADIEDAHNAKKTFDRSLLDGQKLRVEIAEPRHRQSKGDSSSEINSRKPRSSERKPELQPIPKLIIRNLPWSIRDSDQLAALFLSYGKIKHATLPKKKPGQSAGYGFVVLRGRKNAEKALKGVNGKVIEGRTLAVDWAVEKDVWEGLQHGDQNPKADGQALSPSNGPQEEADNIAEDDKVLDSTKSSQSISPQSIGRHSDSPSTSRSESPASSSTEKQESNLIGSATLSESNTSTLFVRNLPFGATDESLREHFISFGPVRYARVVYDPATDRPKGTGFVSFYQQEDAESCLHGVPRETVTNTHVNASSKGATTSSQKPSLLEDTSIDPSGRYTFDGRVLQISRAVDRSEAARLTFASANVRDVRDKDKRRLYLLSEGTIPSGSPLYEQLPPAEIRLREDSARQRQSLIRSNPTLHLSLTRLSVRNLPRSITSKDLKALSREAVVGFAKDVKAGSRTQLSKEEESRGGDNMREAEKARKAKGKGIVKQAKVVFEGREGSKIAEDSGAGRSRGYGFIEYSSHRWALMGLRWLNGHAVEPSATSEKPVGPQDRKKRLIVEFAIENAQVVGRRLERESKARERSKVVDEKRRQGEIAAPSPKALSKDQLMAKTRKGMKRKRESTSDPHAKGNVPGAVASPTIVEKGGKRQQIIGRKRMLRKAKRSA